MFLIASSVDLLKRNLIARGLSAVCESTRTLSFIVDFSCFSQKFWTAFGVKFKFIEDVLSVISGLNKEALKSYLLPAGFSAAIALRNSNFKELNPDQIVQLFSCLAKDIDYVFAILPDNADDLICKLLAQESRAVIFPYFSDFLSTQNAISFYKRYLSFNKKINPIFLKLDLQNHFLSGDSPKSEILQNEISVPFNWKLQEAVLSPTFSHLDKKSSYVCALGKVLAVLADCKSESANNKAKDYNYDGKNYKNLKNNILIELIEEMREFVDETDNLKLKSIVESKIDGILKKSEIFVSSGITAKLYKELYDEVAGLGILEDFLSDNTISEIMVNGTDGIFVEKNGKIIKTDAVFENNKKIKSVIDKVVAHVGRRVDESSPIVDARLKDGSRVNAVIPPVSLGGPVLTIRKFLKDKLSAQSLISSGTADEKVFKFLKNCVLMKKNIIISGGTGTGKTTLLNAISAFIPDEERIITIEDSAELQLLKTHVVRLESRPKSTEGFGEITIRSLVVSALRMRPDRIIVGECRAGEALDMLQAMSTGHEGSLTTLHANCAQDAISRLTVMTLMAGMNLPERSVISQIASTINIIIQLDRFSDGSRKISSICQIDKTDNEQIYKIKEIVKFKYDSESMCQGGRFIWTDNTIKFG
ncbi:MAG: CpaF family protein [Elusimicrobiota bacterium]|jgi:pilus assembly protein CpaF|nr:CpaF family protein [Elusimicrobiota bacterium]